MTIQESILKIKTEHLSCIAQLKIGTYESDLKGLAPLLIPLRQDPTFFVDAVIVDRVIGKSAAFLLIKGKIKSLHALILSQHALDLLNDHKIPVTYDKLVPFIINNTNTGMCPMEASVLHETDPDKAFQILIDKVDAMRRKD